MSKQKLYIEIEHDEDNMHVDVRIVNPENLPVDSVAASTAETILAVFDAFMDETEEALNEDEIDTTDDLYYMTPRGEA